MPPTATAQASTRSFARVLGPFLIIVPPIIIVKAQSMTPALTSFFGNPALVFITAALFLFAGVFVIANHQVWRGGPPPSSSPCSDGSWSCGVWL